MLRINNKKKMKTKFLTKEGSYLFIDNNILCDKDLLIETEYYWVNKNGHDYLEPFQVAKEYMPVVEAIPADTALSWLSNNKTKLDIGLTLEFLSKYFIVELYNKMDDKSIFSLGLSKNENYGSLFMVEDSLQNVMKKALTYVIENVKELSSNVEFF